MVLYLELERRRKVVGVVEDLDVLHGDGHLGPDLAASPGPPEVEPIRYLWDQSWRCSKQCERHQPGTAGFPGGKNVAVLAGAFDDLYYSSVKNVCTGLSCT